MITRSTWCCLIAVVAACSGQPETDNGLRHLPEYPSRLFAATAWDTVASFGPESVDDTVLMTPTGITAWDDRLVVPEWPHARVRVFDRRGTPLWTYGRRGAGPGEIEQMVAVEATPWGNLWIMDGKNNRILELDTAGTLVRSRRAHHLPAVPTSVTFLSADRVLLGTQSPLAGRIIADTDSIKAERVAPSLWGDSVDHRYNIRLASDADPRTGRWVEALTYGPGFATGVGESVTGLHPYVDEIPWALKSGPAIRAVGADSARYGALGVQIVDDEIYMRFGGRPKRRAHDAEPTVLIDVYAFSGEYRRSYLLPMPTTSGEVLGRELFAVSGYHQGVLPRVFLLSPRGFPVER
jgi:hypothetical protein